MSFESPGAAVAPMPDVAVAPPPIAEVSPVPPAQPEAPAANEPSIFDVYGERQVTYFGVTGTLNSLVDMCPVEQAERDPAKMQRAAAKILQQAGVEVEDRFLGLLK